MTRMRSILGQWGLLAVGLLAAALLALHEPAATLPALQAPAATLPAGVETYHGAQVYDVGQVLAGVCHQPNLWIGRTILVRADATNLTNLQAGSLFFFGGSCVSPNQGRAAGEPDQGTSSTMLYAGGHVLNTICSPRFPCDVQDPSTDPLNPDNWRAVGTMGPPTRIYRTTLISSPYCDVQFVPSCVLAKGARLVSRS